MTNLLRPSQGGRVDGPVPVAFDASAVFYFRAVLHKYVPYEGWVLVQDTGEVVVPAWRRSADYGAGMGGVDLDGGDHRLEVTARGADESVLWSETVEFARTSTPRDASLLAAEMARGPFMNAAGVGNDLSTRSDFRFRTVKDHDLARREMLPYTVYPSRRTDGSAAVAVHPDSVLAERGVGDTSFPIIVVVPEDAVGVTCEVSYGGFHPEARSDRGQGTEILMSTAMTRTDNPEVAYVLVRLADLPQPPEGYLVGRTDLSWRVRYTDPTAGPRRGQWQALRIMHVGLDPSTEGYSSRAPIPAYPPDGAVVTHTDLTYMPFMWVPMLDRYGQPAQGSAQLQIEQFTDAYHRRTRPVLTSVTFFHIRQSFDSVMGMALNIPAGVMSRSFRWRVRYVSPRGDLEGWSRWSTFHVSPRRAALEFCVEEIVAALESGAGLLVPDDAEEQVLAEVRSQIETEPTALSVYLALIHSDAEAEEAVRRTTALLGVDASSDEVRDAITYMMQSRRSR